jgi:hypothetical protein
LKDESVGDSIRKMLSDAVKKAGNAALRKAATERIDFLAQQADALIDHLGANADDLVEFLVEELVTSNIMRGIAIGKKYGGTPESLLAVISSGGIDVRLVLDALPKKKRETAEFVVHSMQLGRLSYETGLALSAFAHLDAVGKHMKSLEKQSGFYFG